METVILVYTNNSERKLIGVFSTKDNAIQWLYNNLVDDTEKCLISRNTYHKWYNYHYIINDDVPYTITEQFIKA
jgi:hypothetical protein